MSDAGGDEGRVSGLAVTAGVVVCLWWAGMHTYAVGAGAVALVVYAALCWVHPMEKCTRCEGGRVWTDARTHFRWCSKCDDSKGFHVRWGRRMWDKRAKGE